MGCFLDQGIAAGHGEALEAFYHGKVVQVIADDVEGVLLPAQALLQVGEAGGFGVAGGADVHIVEVGFCRELARKALADICCQFLMALKSSWLMPAALWKRVPSKSLAAIFINITSS